MTGKSCQHARRYGAALAIASLVAAPPVAARAQEEIKLTVAAGHPTVFLWVKHLKGSLIATVDAELARTGKYKIAWTEAYGGTLAKIGSELETMQQGISDLGIVATVFQSGKLPLNNVTYFAPYGPADADTITELEACAFRHRAREPIAFSARAPMSSRLPNRSQVSALKRSASRSRRSRGSVGERQGMEAECEHP